jgi:hypothetical protein
MTAPDPLSASGPAMPSLVAADAGRQIDPSYTVRRDL